MVASTWHLQIVAFDLQMTSASDNTDSFSSDGSDQSDTHQSTKNVYLKACLRVNTHPVSQVVPQFELLLETRQVSVDSRFGGGRGTLSELWIGFSRVRSFDNGFGGAVSRCFVAQLCCIGDARDHTTKPFRQPPQGRGTRPPV